MSGRAGRYKGQWMPNDCNTKLPYICEKEGTKAPVTPAPEPGQYAVNAVLGDTSN